MKISFFATFAEEHRAETSRRAQLTPEQRLSEFEQVQERAFGSRWLAPLQRVATWERVDWLEPGETKP
jgi:hypothetical protein